MNVEAVLGPAGSGKTFWLLERLRSALDAQSLGPDQRILALSYMHGGRRRLHQRLRSIPAMGQRHECVTIDSFAGRVLQRWRGLAQAVGIPSFSDGEFEGRCDAAGSLLEHTIVAQWVAATFPIIIVDEAQDLSPERLRIVKALARHSHLLIALDEFQCLDVGLRDNPTVTWVGAVCQPTALGVCHRTSIPKLLAAASDLRQARPLSAESKGAFRIMPSKGTPPMAAAVLASAIAWRKGGNVAVITPALKGGFSQKVVDRVRSQPCGKNRLGPFDIRWESGQEDEIRDLVGSLDLAETVSIQQALDCLSRLPAASAVRATQEWTRLRARATSLQTVSAAELRDMLSRQVVLSRSFQMRHEHRFTALTVHQAKNREFDGVVVLWPFTVGGDAEHKRRLLYNAVTRARRWCTVIPQSEDLLQSAPFGPA
jgi:hypothetical protein